MFIKFILLSLFLSYFLIACSTSFFKSESTTLSHKLQENVVNEYSDKLDSLYQLDTIITLSGKIKSDKSGAHINGVYLEKAPNMEGLLEIKGTLKRVLYPLSYYSTDESPQGMFSDTSVKHYRLFLEPRSIKSIAQ